jgi:hypothetical protein
MTPTLTYGGTPCRQCGQDATILALDTRGHILGAGCHTHRRDIAAHIVANPGAWAMEVRK